MKRALFLIPATAACLLSFTTHVHAYNNVYVFGDSLSDGGNIGRFTTDGKDSELYDEYIADKLTGKKLIPSERGGTNYAYGGATTNGAGDPSDFFVNSTEKQLDDYLKAHSGRADPNGVYIHWVGGNNIAYALKQFASGGKEHFINYGAADAASQVNKLLKAGAGLVIVPNVPDVGITPKILEAVLRAALEKKGLPKKEIDNTIKQVHQAINKYPTPNNEYRNKIIEGVFKQIADKNSPQDPNKAKEVYRQLLDAYNKNSKMASEFSDEFNRKEDEQLGDGNILRADINGLLREVIENPTIYGFSNTLGYACPPDLFAAMHCSSSDPDFDNSQSYLFSDEFHPTPAAHKIIGQYIMSIYNAPLQVIALNSINRIPVTNTLSSLDGHLQQLRNGHHAQGKIGVFGGYTGNNNTTLVLGSDYQLTDNLLLGVTLSRYRNEQDATSNFSYSATAHVVTAYTQWNYDDNGWVNGDLHYSRTHYDSLTRAIQLGSATRRETGSTTGKQWGAHITAGWNIPVTPYLSTSPIVQYAWDKGTINGYRESGKNSTSMHFGEQRYNSKVGSIGWRVDTQLGRFNPYASILFNHQFDDESYTVRSAINWTKTSFVQPGQKQDRNHVQYTVGVNANLTNNFHAFTAVSHEKSDNSPDNNYNFSFGFNVSF
ncbi:outer membrane esterase [Xenorhabdus beddingii]|uniref:Outer membrane esterase n=1 Tax=Xenorhabdus beddingii TaxID=40578 RepID=A0A1Y2SKR3_9GAMM|nr:autotransporter domain-containing protein [Xenorhabdus beddingii]OTA19541.1 outer membrane esterase [Xenorhabdus beddingii]